MSTHPRLDKHTIENAGLSELEHLFELYDFAKMLEEENAQLTAKCASLVAEAPADSVYEGPCLCGGDLRRKYGEAEFTCNKCKETFPF